MASRWDAQTNEERIAIVHRELAELEERQRASELEPRRQRRSNGTSVVYSLRLDTREFAALEDRARRLGLKSSVLARNLIRSGLASREGESVARALDRLEHAVSELRAVVG